MLAPDTVLVDRPPRAAMLVQGDAALLPFADDTFDLVMGSPPYAAARTYGIKADRPARPWAHWMARVTVEALRVSRGPVVWVVDDQVRDGRLEPGVALLQALLYRAGVIAERPLIWTSSKPPSRKGKWWSHNWEYVLVFKKAATLPYFDCTATAEPPKYTTAGAFRQRRKDGGRPKELRKYVAPALANPRDVIRAIVGGGHMGHPLAHQSEAPYPESLVKQILPVLCPPGGRVLDPFNGSGTTIDVADQLGRVGVGLDIRMNQCDLAARRLATPVVKAEVAR